MRIQKHGVKTCMGSFFSCILCRCFCHRGVAKRRLHNQQTYSHKPWIRHSVTAARLIVVAFCHLLVKRRWLWQSGPVMNRLLYLAAGATSWAAAGLAAPVRRAALLYLDVSRISCGLFTVSNRFSIFFQFTVNVKPFRAVRIADISSLKSVKSALTSSRWKCFEFLVLLMCSRSVRVWQK